MAIYDISLYDKLRFLKHKRIEIDSIIAKVGSEMFWEFVEHKLSERFPTRNYNRAIDIPEFVYPDIVEVMLEQLQKILAVTVKQERQCIENELSKVSGFLDPQEKEQEVESRLKDTITGVNKKDIQPILKKVKELLVVIKRREDKVNLRFT
jgi:hypothetical protein